MKTSTFNKKGTIMKTTTLLLTPLVIMAGLATQSMATEESNITTGSTLGYYSKPGAAIDMTFTSTNVQSNETSDVNITLITTAPSGTIQVGLSFDENLTQISSVEENLSFQISPQQKEYPINLQVASQKDGLYYIRLLTQVNGKMRSFAIPITVGKPVAKTKSKNIMKAMNGENISVSKAIETITVLDEE
jgi:hypothetical protein